MIAASKISRTGKAPDPETLLERKLKACRLFLAATTKLKAALAEENAGAALQLLQDRGELIRVIGVLDNLIDRGHPPRGEIKGGGNSCRRRIRQTLQDIERENLACERLSAAHCRDLIVRLCSLRQQGKGVREYASPGEALPKFISCKS